MQEATLPEGIDKLLSSTLPLEGCPEFFAHHGNIYQRYLRKIVYQHAEAYLACTLEQYKAEVCCKV